VNGEAGCAHPTVHNSLTNDLGLLLYLPLFTFKFNDGIWLGSKFVELKLTSTKDYKRDGDKG
jgi:hypothetical protein